MFLMAISGVYAQASLYTFAQSSGTYVPITGGTVITTSASGTPNLDSYVSAAQTLPTAINFAGNSYTQYYVTGNGQVSLGTPAPSGTTYAVLSTSSGSNVFFAPLSADLDDNTGESTIRVEQVGDEIVFQWTNFKRYARTETINFQVRANTVSGVIKFVYDGNPPYDTSTAYQPQVGLKSSTAANGYLGLSVASGASWNTPTVVTTGVSSSTTAAFTGATGPTSGLTYTFTPPLPCSGTPVAGTVTGNLTRSLCNGAAPGVIAVTGATDTYPGISYQWQESLNGTDWANATGGSGATTLSYTPPSFAGTPIQYRLKVTCATSSETVYSSVVNIVNVTSPVTQATALMASTSVTNAVLNWTGGNGARRLVVLSTSPIVAPSSGSAVPAYTAASAFTNSGQQIVYEGTGSSVTISGLTCNTTYYAAVFEYNRCGSGPYDVYFNTTQATNALTFVTGPATAALPVTNNFTGFTGANLYNVFPGWYEAAVTTTSGTTPVENAPVGITSGWVSSSNLGSPTAKINLYYNTKNDWIISPKMQITANSRLKFKAALTDYNSGSADPAAMQGTDDKVKVMVSTDGCGASWTPIYTFSAGNTTTLTNVLTDFEVLLNAYIGQTIQIAFLATDGPTDDLPDYDFHIGDIVIEEIPACEIPTLAATTNVTKNSATINWEAPTTGTPTGYEYVVSTSNTAPAGAGTAVTGLTANVSSLTPATTYYVFVRSVCGAGVFSDWTMAGEFMTLCAYPDLTATTPGAACGQGEVELSATAASGELYWYAAATGGDILDTGATFTTPLITETTSFYVSSANSQPDVDVMVGEGNETSATYSNPFYSLWSNNHTQHLITAQDLLNAGLSAGPVNSIALDVTSAGTLPMINLSVKIGTTTATSMDSFASDALTVVFTSASYMPTTGINTLTFDAPFMWDGTSNILVEFCHGNPSSGATMNRTVRADATSYVSSIKRHFSTSTSAADVCSATSGGTVASYNVRPQFYFNGVGLCFSPRQEVVATITDAPALTVSGDPAGVCAGETTAVVTLTAGASDYDTFTWSPATGVTGDAATGWTFNPSVSTTYTLTASQSAAAMCTATTSVDVTINPLPSAINVAPAAPMACAGEPLMLTLNGASISGDYIVGTGTSLTGTTEQPTAFCNRWPNYWSQTIYTAQELNALGLNGGSIVSMAYNITTLGDSATNDNFVVRIGTTNNNNFGNTTFLASTGFTTVYGPETYTHTATGWQVITFTTPYVWDGVSNIVVEVMHDGADDLYNSQTYYTETADNKVLYKTSYTGSTTTGTTSPKRLNVKFGVEASDAITWSPAANLYTDSDATVPYVSGANAVTLYYMAESAGTDEYTITSSTLAGCTQSGSVTVTVTETPAPVATVVSPGCGETTGSVTITAPLGAEYTYSINGTDFQAGASFADVAAGTYTVTAMNAEGCTKTSSVTIENAPEVPATPSLSVSSPGCGETTGVIDIIEPINASYTYSINGTDYQSSSAFFDLAPGTYNVTIMSAGGCVSEAAVATIDAAPAVPASPVATVVNPGCGETTGSVTITAPVGAEFTYSIDGTDFQPGTSFADLAAGTYTITVTNAAGCTATATVTVEDAPAVPAAPQFSVVNPACDETTGSVEISSPVGADYTYSIDGTNFQAGTMFNAVAPGTYTVTVMNAAGCTATAEVTVEDAPVIAAPVIDNTTPSFCTAATVADLSDDATLVWYDAATDGNALTAETALTDGMMYYAAQVSNNCESVERTAVTVTITTVDAPAGNAQQTLNGDIASDVTLDDIVVNGNGGTIIWYASEANALAGENPLDMSTELMDGATYYAVQVDGDCSSAPFAVTVTVILSDRDFETTTFTYYPNPVKDVLTLDASSEVTSVAVFNMLGQQVMALQPGTANVKLDMSVLSDGTYLVNVTSASAVKTIKVVKKQ